MDPTSLAASAVAILVPYLAEAGREFAKEAGKTALDKIGALYKTLQARFKSKPSAQEALADLESEPGNQDAQATLRRQLTKEMKADQSLVETLRELVEEIEKDRPSQSFLTQVYGGEVGQIINAGHIDSISYTPPPRSKKESKQK